MTESEKEELRKLIYASAEYSLEKMNESIRASNQKTMTFYTTIQAICPITGDLKTFAGPKVPGIDIASAKQYCQDNGLGYCHVQGQSIETISIGEEPISNYENLN